MMRKSIIVIFVLLVIILTSFSLFNIFSKDKPLQTSGVKTPAIPINYTNLESQLVKNSIVKAIPSESVILLRFFNFDTGSRTWENSYIINSTFIMKINESNINEDNYEIIVLMHSKYLKELTTSNFCSIIKKANTNGDLAIETQLSSVELGWKFKSLYKFKDCF